MIEANKFKLGIFITVGVFLIISGIFIFGISQFFTEKIEIYTVFTDEVDGLTIGSPVKFNGVNIGKVSHIYICDSGNIEVRMNMILGSIEKKIRASIRNNLSNASDLPKTMETMVKSGLRCSLQFRGITGEKYVKLSYIKGADPREYLRIAPGENGYYIPSVPSYLGSALDNISTILEDISRINFKEFANNLNKNLQALDKISNNLESLSKVNFKEVTDNLNQDLHTLGKLADRMEKSLIYLNAQELNSSLLNTMNKLDEMSDSITTLSNNINSNPSSIVWGKKEEPVLKE